MPLNPFSASVFKNSTLTILIIIEEKAFKNFKFTRRIFIMNEIIYHSIGVIHAPFKEPHSAPMQVIKARDIDGYIEMFSDFLEGLKDLEGFSHIIILFHMHEVKDFSLLVKPELDNEFRGVFSTRSPRRPNPIGLTIAELVKIEGPVIHIKGVDVIDGTPLLDIKPYIPESDSISNAKIGWLEGK